MKGGYKALVSVVIADTFKGSWMKSSRLLMNFLPFSAEVKCHRSGQFRVEWPDTDDVCKIQIRVDFRGTWQACYRRHKRSGQREGGEIPLLSWAPFSRACYQSDISTAANFARRDWRPPIKVPFSHFNLLQFVHLLLLLLLLLFGFWIGNKGFTRSLTLPRYFGAT